MAKSGRLERGDKIYGHYRFIFKHCDVFGQHSKRILWKHEIGAITPFKDECELVLITNRKSHMRFRLVGYQTRTRCALRGCGHSCRLSLSRSWPIGYTGVMLTAVIWLGAMVHGCSWRRVRAAAAGKRRQVRPSVPLGLVDHYSI